MNLPEGFGRLEPPLRHALREPGTVVDTVVLHATVVTTVEETIRVLRERDLSYHAVVDRDGTGVLLAPVEAVAFHAGESRGPQGPGVNRYSVGLSLVNLNDGIDPYPSAQTHGATRLIVWLRECLPSLAYLTSHALVSPGRKNDPLGLDLAPLAVATGLAVWAGD